MRAAPETQKDMEREGQAPLFYETSAGLRGVKSSGKLMSLAPQGFCYSERVGA